jgi:hypothetical protein
MAEDTTQLVKALIFTAGLLQGYAQKPPYVISGDPIIPLTPKSCLDLAGLLERAANQLIEGGKSE